jgi:hypothetical protein
MANGSQPGEKVVEVAEGISNPPIIPSNGKAVWVSWHYSAEAGSTSASQNGHTKDQGTVAKGSLTNMIAVSYGLKGLLTVEAVVYVEGDFDDIQALTLKAHGRSGRIPESAGATRAVHTYR